MSLLKSDVGNKNEEVTSGENVSAVVPQPQQKSKADLRRERREVQEAQRAAKLAQATKKSVSSTDRVSKPDSHSSTHPKGNKKPSNAGTVIAIEPSQKTPVASGVSQERTGQPQPIIKNVNQVTTRLQEVRRVHLFRNLKEPDKRIDVVGNLGLGGNSPIHPSFLALGINSDEGRIWGANERCLCFLRATETLISSFSNKQNTVCPDSLLDRNSFTRSFGPLLQRHVDYLNTCRPLAVTQENAYQFIKQTLGQLDAVYDVKECQTRLLSALEDFRQTTIHLACAEIADRASAAIRPGECVCTFSYSTVVARVLERAWLGAARAGPKQEKGQCEGEGTLFSVIVVDSSPRFEGRKMLARLSKLGIPCEYTHIAAFPTLAHKVSLAIVGAEALLNNGHVLARMGTAQMANIVSVMAHAPTLVCAETYKFCERAHSDAVEFNELTDPDDLWRGPRGTHADPMHVTTSQTAASPGSARLPDLRNWRSNERLRLLHLVFDVLPPRLVTAVVTEKGTLPTSSVPVVLRVKQATAVPA